MEKFKPFQRKQTLNIICLCMSLSECQNWRKKKINNTMVENEVTQPNQTKKIYLYMFRKAKQLKPVYIVYFVLINRAGLI